MTILALVAWIMGVGVPGTAAAASIRDCSLFRYADLAGTALETLQSMAQTLPEDGEALRNLTGRAYDTGLIQRVPDCTEPVVRAYGSRTSQAIELRALNVEQCRSLVGDPRLGAAGVTTFIFSARTDAQIAECVTNPVTALLGVNRVGLNNVTLLLQRALPAPPDPWGQCREVALTPGAREPVWEIDFALYLMRVHSSLSRDMLARFAQRGGRLRYCPSGPHTYYLDGRDEIRLGRGVERWDGSMTARVLIEELAHAFRTDAGWPDPRAMTRRQFVAVNTERLLDMETEALVVALSERDIILDSVGIAIPMLPPQLNAGDSRLLADQWSDLNSRGASLSERIAALRPLMEGLRTRAPSGDILTYADYYRRESARIHDCAARGDHVVFRGRWICG